jgi:uncharacterized peroxidase-related enzyme
MARLMIPTRENAPDDSKPMLFGPLDMKTRHPVALAVSQANDCNYCKALHSFVFTNVDKNDPEELALNLQASSFNPKTVVVAIFAKRLIETRGKVNDEDLDAVRKAGFSEAQIVEIVASSSQVLMTNFMNNVACTEIDVPAAM